LSAEDRTRLGNQPQPAIAAHSRSPSTGRRMRPTSKVESPSSSHRTRARTMDRGPRTLDQFSIDRDPKTRRNRHEPHTDTAATSAGRTGNDGVQGSQTRKCRRMVADAYFCRKSRFDNPSAAEYDALCAPPRGGCRALSLGRMPRSVVRAIGEATGTRRVFCKA